MPKSRHRKNHKKKVVARRKRLEQKRASFRKMMEEKYGEKIAEELLKQTKLNNEEIDLN